MCTLVYFVYCTRYPEPERIERMNIYGSMMFLGKVCLFNGLLILVLAVLSTTLGTVLNSRNHLHCSNRGVAYYYSPDRGMFFFLFVFLSTYG